jgi:single-stranded DNA-binding protein
MSKKNIKDCAYVNLVGTVVYSDVVRYENNQKELHNYFIQVTEKYEDKDGNGKERKYSFKATQFNLKRNTDIFVKGDRVKIKGILKVNSYKNDEDEWVNQPYIMITKIDFAE